jgi:hypothetical protein
MAAPRPMVTVAQRWSGGLVPRAARVRISPVTPPPSHLRKHIADFRFWPILLINATFHCLVSDLYQIGFIPSLA